MRKIIFLLFALCCTCVKAQLFTKSYSAVKNYSISSMGVIQGVPMGAQYIDFYDNYIVLWGFGNKYVYKTTNLDGSRQYVPASLQDILFKKLELLYLKIILILNIFNKCLL